MYRLGIDLGGTNIAAGVVDEDCRILGRAKLRTGMPRPGVEIMEDICRAGEEAVGKANLSLQDIVSVGLASPGIVDNQGGKIVFAGNLGFCDQPVRPALAHRFGADIHLANDASAAAYGEMLAGAGKGMRDFAIITLGTGLGCGIIVDGKIHHGFNHTAGELGHTVIEFDGIPCNCGRKGCAEKYVSATALISQTKEAMESHPTSKLWDVCGRLDDVDGRTAFDAARLGDDTARAVVDRYIRYLGCVAVNVVNLLDPEMICLGGGVAGEGDAIISPLREYIDRESFSRNQNRKPVLKRSLLGGDAGIIGAAFLDRL